MAVILDLTQTLSELVTIPSVNPMGRDAIGTPFYEDRLSDYLEVVLRGMGLDVSRQPVAPRRDNVIGRLDGSRAPDQGGRIVLLDAHQDTVPADGMTIAPFVPEIRDGRLYGRGSCDTKGGMAAMLWAVARLAEERPPDMPTVVIACTVNEEHGFTGAAALTRLWTEGSAGPLARRPDAAIVAEPTELDVVVAHKGVVRWQCHALGRACHGSQPDSGDNAIYRMARALTAIERYAAELTARVRDPSRADWTATLSVGTIRGGVSVNTVPDRCTIEIDRRLLPGEAADHARADLIGYLAAAGLGYSLQHDAPDMTGPAMSGDLNGPLAEGLSDVVRSVAGACQRIAVPYATNAAFYAAAGVPSVVFGPGSLRQAHTNDEWVSLAQVQQAAEVYYRFCRQSRSGILPPFNAAGSRV